MSKKKVRAPKPKQRFSDRVYSREARIISDSGQELCSATQNIPIDGYKDPTKVFHKNVDEAIRKRVEQMHHKFVLPAFIRSVVSPRISDALVINCDGRSRELLPDVQGRHIMLCHGSLARVVKSGIGVFSKITTAQDGSWIFRPAGLDMMYQTTIQHVRRRRFWFLRRYGYEISFDARVQPAMMLYDYGLDPTRQRQRFFVSCEEVPIRDSDKHNTFFRFWLDRHNIGR